MKRFIVLLMASPLLFGAVVANAQIIPQPIKRTEATATATTTKTPDGKVTTTQTNKVVTTAPAAAPPVKPAVPVTKPEPKAVVHHSTGRERFLVGKIPPKIAAPLVAASLKIDPMGNHPIDPAHCSGNSDGCATPNDFLVGYQHSDPDYGLTDVSQLVDYMTNNLEVQAAPEGKMYWMACLVRTGNGTHKVVWNCLARAFHEGETVYVSKKTGRLVQARDCANPIGAEDIKKVVEDCDEIIVWLNPGDEIHRFWLSNQGPFPKDKCNALMKAGENEWSYELLDECPRDHCDGSRPAQDLHLAVQGSAVSFKAATAGWHHFRISKEVEHLDGAFVFCVIWTTGPDAGYMSMGKAVFKTAYHSLGEAYIVYPDGPHKSVEQIIPPEWLGKPKPLLNSGELAPK